MKKNIALIITIIFISISCENYNNNQEVTNPPEMEYLLSELDNELDLSSDQRSSARTSLENGRDYHPDLASLWELAANLNETLTQAQKDSLIYRIRNINSQIISEENDQNHGRLIHLQSMHYRISMLISDAQIPFYQNLVSEKTSLIEGILNQYQDSIISKNQMRINMMSIMEWFRTEISLILTDEQDSLLSIHRNQTDQNFRRARRHWGRFAQNQDEVKQARINALQLTAEQTLLLDSLTNSFEIDILALKNTYVDNLSIMTPEVFRLKILNLFQMNSELRKSVYTENQLQIIEIHRALSIRFMRKNRWG
tara:strand:+ start:1055 stop:1987 length:933 start_codon:yes stop_codon:yes gene_type:complete